MLKLVMVLAVVIGYLPIFPTRALATSANLHSVTSGAHYERPSTQSGPYKERVIVFVHGIFGNADDTWRYSPTVYWPRLLLSDSAFGDSDIYVASYPTPYSGNTMNIDEVVTNLNNRLVRDKIFSKHREVVFVCHSLGGLVVQRLLLTFREYARQVPFIYFFSTPETGAQIAKLGSVFSADPLIKEMLPGDSNDYLLNLENEWRGAQFHIHRLCAYEKKTYKGMLIVDRLGSTRNCDDPPIAVSDNHIGIVKPDGANHDSYVALRNAVERYPIASAKPSVRATATKPKLAVKRSATVGFKHTALVFRENYSSVFAADKPIEMKVVFENTGDSTAKEVRANGVLRLMDMTPGIREREEQRWQEFRKDWISSFEGGLAMDLDGHKTDHFEIGTERISENDANDLRNEQKLVYFLGAIKWSDDTGEYETDVCNYFRPSTRGPAEAPALWYDCLSGHNEIHKLFRKFEAAPPPRVTASLNIEVFPVIDLGSGLAYYAFQMTNVGNLPANSVNRITLVNTFLSPARRVTIDQEFIKFEQMNKTAPFGDNAIGVAQVANGKIQITGLSFQDLLDIQGGLKTLYVFTILKYKDGDHELLETKSCVSFTRGIVVSCDGHNEVP
jgi:pimeloyl-ACP methyl ester carboxylesterase